MFVFLGSDYGFPAPYSSQFLPTSLPLWIHIKRIPLKVRDSNR